MVLENNNIKRKKIKNGSVHNPFI